MSDNFNSTFAELKEKIPEYAVKPNRGKAIIFSHRRFKQGFQSERFGTEFDCNRLENILKNKLQFHVEKPLVDQTKKQILSKVEKLASEDHSKSDCILIVIMTHGGEGKKLCANDGEYELQDVINILTSKDAHDSLAGKPKLLFIQACRGVEEDKGKEVAFHKTIVDEGKKSKFIIPLNSDILIAYAATEGYASFRNKKTGSWFIQSLCEVLDYFGNDYDICTLLMMVNRLVARGYGNENRKQMPCIISMLTAQLKFTQKSFVSN